MASPKPSKAGDPEEFDDLGMQLLNAQRFAHHRWKEQHSESGREGPLEEVFRDRLDRELAYERKILKRLLASSVFKKHRLQMARDSLLVLLSPKGAILDREPRADRRKSYSKKSRKRVREAYPGVVEEAGRAKADRRMKIWKGPTSIDEEMIELTNDNREDWEAMDRTAADPLVLRMFAEGPAPIEKYTRSVYRDVATPPSAYLRGLVPELLRDQIKFCEGLQRILLAVQSHPGVDRKRWLHFDRRKDIRSPWMALFWQQLNLMLVCAWFAGKSLEEQRRILAEPPGKELSLADMRAAARLTCKAVYPLLVFQIMDSRVWALEQHRMNDHALAFLETLATQPGLDQSAVAFVNLRLGLRKFQRRSYRAAMRNLQVADKATSDHRKPYFNLLVRTALGASMWHAGSRGKGQEMLETVERRVTELQGLERFLFLHYLSQIHREKRDGMAERRVLLAALQEESAVDQPEIALQMQGRLDFLRRTAA